jgi:hypothetical protein
MSALFLVTVLLEIIWVLLLVRRINATPPGTPRFSFRVWYWRLVAVGAAWLLLVELVPIAGTPGVLAQVSEPFVLAALIALDLRTPLPAR